MMEELPRKALDGRRITSEEAMELFRSNDMLEPASTANELRNRRTDPDVVTYIVDRNINYTNICMSCCDFCAFYRDKGDPEGYVLDGETLDEKIQETIDNGGTQILLQGGLNPDLEINFFENLFRHIKERFDIHLHALSPPEIVHISEVSSLSIMESILRLRRAGLDTIPGGGAEILSDSIRSRVSPRKCTASQWVEVMETAHNMGIRTTATMMFGHGDSIEERVEHLTRVRELQDRTGGFTAFIPWTYQPANTRLGGSPIGGFEYLKTLAICRIYLDNFVNIQASWVTQDKGVGTVALKFGANDMGGIMMEENVVAAAGCSYSMTEREVRRLIAEMGYRPMKRNTYYELLEEGAKDEGISPEGRSKSGHPGVRV